MSVVTALRRMFRNRKGELAACVIGVLGGWLISLQVSQADSNQPPSQESVVAQESVTVEEADPRELFVEELAKEFKIDPSIVRMVHRFSEEYVDQSLEWRLLRNPEAVTYLMLSIIHTESRGNPSAVGDQGQARGLTQIWVSTASHYGDVTAEQLLDPETNIRYSYKHFHYLLKKYKGNFPLALYGWNRGPGTVDRLIRYGNSPANGYGRKVYHAAQRRDAERQLMGN